MRIDKIRLSGFTTYKQEAELDLAALGPGIIAVAGPNGSGKTTLLEAIPGAIYRQTPSRGSVASIATARDAKIELVGENGAPFTVRLDVDAHNGRQEAVAIDGAGEPLAGPKVKDYDRFVAEHFPSPEVYLASFFASQTGVGSVLKMSRSDRRALFGKLLGIERLENMAEEARFRARAVEADMAASRAALDAIRDGAEDVATLEAEYKEAKEREAAAAGAARQAGEKLKEATAARDRLVEEAKEYERASLTAREARAKANSAKADLAGLEAKVAAIAPILERGPEIRAAAARIQALEAELEKARALGEEKAAEHTVLQAEATRAARAYEQANFAHKEADRALRDAEARVGEAEVRIRSAKKATAGVPCAGLLDDEKRSGCPALVGHFKTEEAARKEIVELNDTLIPMASEAFKATSDKKLAAEKEVVAANAKLNAVGGELGEYRLKYRKAQEELSGLKAKDESAKLARAEAEMAGHRLVIDAARKTYETAQAEADRLWSALGAPPDLGAPSEARAALAAAQVAHEAALLDVQDEAGRVVRLDEQLKRARDAQAKAAALAAKHAPMETELAEWRWLGRGLGREGVQALELDAAGPRVSGLANELLADAYGSRFQIRFETQAAKADGKGVKETFDVVVVDTERGREGNGEDLSGGEKVIVGEALGLAVGLFHAQAAGVSLGTVIRDETVGALDPENGEKYLAMLRAFLRVGRVHQLLYVAHNPALVDMADAVVRVEDGRIEVR